MARTIQEPTVSERDSHGHVKTDHPAFAQIGVSRVSGYASLYGSDFRHQHYMTIRIAASTLNRSLSEDQPFASNKKYIEVSLSEAQWCQFVSSPNVGSGTQCTLTQFAGEVIPGLPDPFNPKDQFAKEAAETMAHAFADLDALRKEVAAMNISQKAKDAILRRADHAARSIGSSVAFVLDQFGEHMEKTVEKAKIEINAYATNTIMHAGLNAISGAKPTLELSYAKEAPAAD